MHDVTHGEDAPQVRAHRPRTDVENIRNNLVGMPLRNHAHDFLLARAELNAVAVGHAQKQVARAIHFGIDQYLFRGVPAAGIDASCGERFD